MSDIKTWLIVGLLSSISGVILSDKCRRIILGMMRKILVWTKIKYKGWMRYVSRSIYYFIIIAIFTIYSCLIFPNIREYVVMSLKLEFASKMRNEKNYDKSLELYNQAMIPIQKNYAEVHYYRGIAGAQKGWSTKDNEALAKGVADLEKYIELDRDLTHKSEICQYFGLIANETLLNSIKMIRETSEPEKTDEILNQIKKSLYYYDFLRKNDPVFAYIYDIIREKRKYAYKKMADIYFFRMRNNWDARKCYKLCEDHQGLTPEDNYWENLTDYNLGRIDRDEGNFLFFESLNLVNKNYIETHLNGALKYYERSVKSLENFEPLIKETRYNNPEYKLSLYSNLADDHLKIAIIKYRTLYNDLSTPYEGNIKSKGKRTNREIEYIISEKNEILGHLNKAIKYSKHLKEDLVIGILAKSYKSRLSNLKITK